MADTPSSAETGVAIVMPSLKEVLNEGTDFVERTVLALLQKLNEQKPRNLTRHHPLYPSLIHVIGRANKCQNGSGSLKVSFQIAP
jgi:hypothetical protein